MCNYNNRRIHTRFPVSRHRATTCNVYSISLKKIVNLGAHNQYAEIRPYFHIIVRFNEKTRGRIPELHSRFVSSAIIIDITFACSVESSTEISPSTGFRERKS